jgi:hypothetical protein
MNMIVVDEGRELAEALQSYGTLLQSDENSDSILGPCLSNLAELYRNEEDANADYVCLLLHFVCCFVSDCISFTDSLFCCPHHCLYLLFHL